MGYDPVKGVGTYGERCLAGCQRQFAWWRSNYNAGSLGCYNPQTMKLHAEGRAMDIALDANDAEQRARGDAIFERVMAHYDDFGAQEMLWRGYIWSYKRRNEGKRYPVQKAQHMNHVHLGLDVNAALHWHESWLGTAPPDPSRQEDHMVLIPRKAVAHGLPGRVGFIRFEPKNKRLISYNGVDFVRTTPEWKVFDYGTGKNKAIIAELKAVTNGDLEFGENPAGTEVVVCAAGDGGTFRLPYKEVRKR